MHHVGSTRGSESRVPHERADGLGAVEFLVVLLRERRLVARSGAVLAALVVVTLLVLPRSYTAIASFAPYSGDATLARAASLAAQFGVSVPSGAAGQSPDFYVEMIKSREMLVALVETEYTVPEWRWWEQDSEGGMMSGSLVELLGTTNANEHKARERAVSTLLDRMTVRADALTGIVAVQVTTGSPELSLQIVRRVLSLVDEFNLSRRTSQASAERKFAEERLRVAQEELRDAEASQQAFLAANRSFRESPQLAFEYQRLERQTALRQGVVNSLAQAYEQARLAEVRDTPVVTEVQPPDVARIPDPRRLALKALAALVFGIIVGVVLAFVRAFLNDERAMDVESAEELDRLRRESINDLRRPWRLVLRDD